MHVEGGGGALFEEVPGWFQFAELKWEGCFRIS